MKKALNLVRMQQHYYPTQRQRNHEGHLNNT